MDEITKAQITQRLNERIGHIECPICHRNTFSLIDGYFISSLQDNPESLIIGGDKGLTSVAIVCINCGFTSFHNVRALEI